FEHGRRIERPETEGEEDDRRDRHQDQWDLQKPSDDVPEHSISRSGSARQLTLAAWIKYLHEPVREQVRGHDGDGDRDAGIERLQRLREDEYPELVNH